MSRDIIHIGLVLNLPQTMKPLYPTVGLLKAKFKIRKSHFLLKRHSEHVGCPKPLAGARLLHFICFHAFLLPVFPLAFNFPLCALDNFPFLWCARDAQWLILIQYLGASWLWFKSCFNISCTKVDFSYSPTILSSQLL